IRVVAGSDRPSAMGLHSRYAADKFVYPSPLRDRAGFVKAVKQQTKAGRTILLAFGDSSLLLLVQDENFLNGNAVYVMPKDRENFDIAFDKARTLELAHRLGVEIPKTELEVRERDLSGIFQDLMHPLVLKPR